MTRKPAVNDPPSAVSVGVRPYEMKNRTEDRVPIFGFEDLSGWTVECRDGAQADLLRTTEQQLWGGYVGKLSYRGTSAKSAAVLRPPKPIPIPGMADSIEMWIYGNNWGWQPDPKTPQVQVDILIEDSSGKQASYPLTNVRWEEWWLAHKKLPEAVEGVSFAGISVSNMSNTEERAIFLDSIYIYFEELPPLKFSPRPKRNLKLFPGQDPGLNTGPGTLPFPTREQTILPTNFSSRFGNSVVERGGAYEFTYSGDDCEVKYVYRPSKGLLGEIEAFVNEKKVCTPMAGGGVQLGAEEAVSGRLVSKSLDDGVLNLFFDFNGVRSEYAFRIWQKSLVMDFICRGGAATGLAFGEITGVQSPRLVLIPFLTLGSHPKVLCAGTPEEPWFLSVWADWYRSNASELWSIDYARIDSARVNGGTRYTPKTDGRRNDLFERIFLTVSPTFEETLPKVDNPPSKLGRIAGERLWQETWGPADYSREHERSRMLRSYGIEKLTQCNHEIAWRDGGESFTIRTVAAPGKGGDEALKSYVAAQKSLGWLSGLYTNYTDLAPVNERWHPDLVQRDPKGEWRPAWPRCYALKPSRAVELDAELAPVIQKKFGSNAAYTDVHTAVPPWYYCDYDARVPGAGTFASTFYAYGELLLNDQRVYGPTWSEGSYHWLYAGLATGNYGLCYPQPDMSRQPLNVAFGLMKIHPLECDIGMPWTAGFFKDSADWQKPENIDYSIDRFIAATIAYGHIGWLVEEAHGINRTCRSYYMLQQLQKRYAMVRPRLIEYADDNGRWLTVSQAIARGALQDSRLHVVYENGLEVFVNGSDADWKLPNARVLPPWGWYARDRSRRFEEFSAILDGHRTDYVGSPEYVYLDGRGSPALHGGIGARGSVAVRRKADAFEVIDIHGNDEIGITAPFPGTCAAYDAEGVRIGTVPVRQAQDGMIWFRVIDKARRYVYKPVRTAAKTPLTIKLPRDFVVAGETLPVEIRLVGAAAGPVRLSFEDGEERNLRVPPLGRATAEMRFPDTLAPGGRVWLKASADLGDGSRIERWHTLRVVPAFDIRSAESENGRARFDVTSNLLSALKPAVRVLARPGGAFTVNVKPEDPLLVSVAAAEECEGVLVVEAESGSFTGSAEFPVRSELAHPVVRNIAEEQGFRWGFAFRGREEVLGNVHGVGEDPGAVCYPGVLECGGEAKKGLFMHPPWVGGVGYTYLATQPFKLPEGECEFRAFVGIKDGGADSDGVTFKVAVVTQDGEQEILSTHWRERRWREVSADLSAYSGKTVSVKLVADVGPDDNSTADWACWGEPRIVEKQPVLRMTVGNRPGFPQR